MLRLLQVVAHDIRNPLGVAQLKAEVMKRRPPNEGKLVSDLDVITRNTSHIARLVDELVDVAAIESGAFDIEAATHDAHGLLDEARVAGGERVELAQSVAGDVTCERSRILQVLATLIGHAVSSSAGPVVVKAKIEGAELTVTVEDTRAAVAEPAHHFERWAHGKSNGLGLTIARGIVTAHGGKMWLDAPASGGAVVAFTLPAQARS